MQLFLVMPPRGPEIELRYLNHGAADFGHVADSVAAPLGENMQMKKTRPSTSTS